MLNAIELYQEKNPNVVVEGEYQGFDGYYEKMMTTLSSGGFFRYEPNFYFHITIFYHFFNPISILDSCPL